MNMFELLDGLDENALGEDMHALLRDLYPICRSITGNGVRQTLQRLQEVIDLQVHEVPSGTEAYDWTVPKEWNIRDAYIKDGAGRRVIDFRSSNLHVVSYSVPIHRMMTLEELRPHLHTLPERPDWIPYRATHYREDWGFCLSHRQLEALPDGTYEVCINSTLEAGQLTYGEVLIRGASEDEVLISCHVCHPSLCNDNLSGIVLATKLADLLSASPLRNSYRFLFIPGTIGAITWLKLNESRVSKIRHGIVLTCVGDPGPITYKKSRRGDAEVDRAFAHVLAERGGEHEVRAFVPYGYDERQYCSPGFNLPVGCLMRTPHGEFPEYHTSADDPDFVRPAALADSLSTCLEVFNVLEHNRVLINLKPNGEPRLGTRGLLTDSAAAGPQELYMAYLWVLNLSDGNNDLLAISNRSGIDFRIIVQAAEALLKTDLLAEERLA